jgi:hypothetical protein
MNTIIRKFSTLAITLAVAAGMTFVAVPKANAQLYICYLIGCDSTYCYYACQPLLGGSTD